MQINQVLLTCCRASIKMVGVLFFVVSGYGESFGQAQKFGKVSKETLEMTSYANDSSAHAVVLFDVGKSYFKYNDIEGFQMIFERHTRIKLFDKEGYTHAQVSVPLYQYGDQKEKVNNLKAVTYHLEGGKIIKEDLAKRDIFEEAVTKNFLRKKFTLPNLKEGCVIEYRYKVVSDFWHYMRDWYFQREIPVMWSEYTTKIPEYFHYKKNAQGYVPFVVNEEQKGSGSFTINGSARGFHNKETKYSEKMDYLLAIQKLAAKDVPAFKVEKYITTPEDYLSKIEYQLTTIHWPNQVPENVSGSWEKIAENLQKGEDFGGFLKKKAAVKSLVESIRSTAKSPEEKVSAAYHYVQNTFKWNEEKSCFSKKGIRTILNEKIGNSASINLLLVLLLRELEIQANPVLLSTRHHGKVTRFHPSLDQFDYVVTHVKLGDKEILLDATSSLVSAGTLPYRCLNGSGLWIGEAGVKWIPLAPDKSTFHGCLASLKVNEEGILTGQVKIIEKGYNAVATRQNILKEKEAKFMESYWETESSGFMINEYRMENTKELEKPVKIELEVESEEPLVGEMLYITPVLEKIFKENPFKQDERKFPVDFGHPFKQNYTFMLDIPKGYAVEELPKSKVIALPENAGKYSYMMGQVGDKLQLRSNLYINKALFLPEEYFQLKEFCAQIIAKQAEQIVLKKTEEK